MPIWLNFYRTLVLPLLYNVIINNKDALYQFLILLLSLKICEALRPLVQRKCDPI